MHFAMVTIIGNPVELLLATMQLGSVTIFGNPVELHAGHHAL